MSFEIGSTSLSALIQALQPALTRDLHAQSCEELFQQEDLVSAVLLQLRSRINALSSVDRLPPEILSKIFESSVYTSRDGGVAYIDSHERIKTPVRTRQLLTITHVYRRWREVALQMAALWTCVDDFKPARLDEFMKRSREAALSLHLQAERPGTLTQLLAQCGHRLKRLDITLHADFLCRLPTFQAFKAPNLDCLTVVSQAGLEVDVSDPTPLLFGARACNLRALAIDPASIWIPINEFPRLTHLYLAKVSSFLSGDVMGPLLELLHNTPALQYLHVEGLSREASFTATTGIASLRSLRALTCGSSDLQSALCLLSIMDLSEDVIIRLDRLNCLTPDHIMLAQPLPCYALLASFTRLEVATKGEGLHLIADSPRAGLWIQVECIDGQWGQWLARLCTMFPLPSVTTLQAQASAVDKQIIPSLLRQLPHLSTVVVHFNAGPLDEDEYTPSQELARVLYAALDVYSPHLEVLVIGAKAAHADELSPSDLISLAAVRFRRGRRLQRLVIDLIDFWPVLEILGIVVPDVNLFRAALAPALEYVGDLELLVNAGACEFKYRELWTMPEAERYWQIPNHQMPYYWIFQ